MFRFAIMPLAIVSTAISNLFGWFAPSSAPAPHVRVSSCQVVSGTPSVPLTDEVGLVVRFRNDGDAPLSSIVWRANFGTTPVDFIDDGEFSPHVSIDNMVPFERGTTHVDVGGVAMNILGLFARPLPTVPAHSMVASNMTLPRYIGTEDPENCTIVRASDADGKLWLNPAVSQMPRDLPTPTPEPKPTPIPPLEASPAVPVELEHCSLQLGGQGVLEVAFRNATTRTAKTIVIRANYARSGIDFTDAGSFTQGSVVKHSLKRTLPDEVRDRSYLSFDDPSACAVVSVAYEDGTQWLNPAASASPVPLPTPIPDMLVLSKQRDRWMKPHGMPTPFPTP